MIRAVPFKLLLLTGLTSALAFSATLPVGPQGALTVNGETSALPAEWQSTDEGKTWRLTWRDPAGTYPLQFLEVQANTDPFLTYAVGFINPFSSTTSFVLNLLVPYVGGPYNQETLSHASTITDGGGATGATVSLNTEANIANSLLDGVVVSGLDSDGCSIPSGSGTCFAGPNAVAAVSSGATGTFGLRLSFMLSRNDSFSSSGSVILDSNVVPEPSTYLFIGTGLAATAALRNRLRRKS